METTWISQVMSTEIEPGGTASCIAVVTPVLGRKLLTKVPNMQGSVGLLRRLIAPSVYKVHVRLSLRDLQQAHEKAGIELTRTEYLMAANLGVFNPNEPGSGALGTTLRWIVAAGVSRLSCAINALDQCPCRLPGHKSFAWYCVSLASTE